MTPYTPEEIALAEEIADDFEKSGCLHGDWRDAYRAALAAIRATTERAAKDELRQRIEALEGALRRIEQLSPDVTHGWAVQARNIARQALGEG